MEWHKIDARGLLTVDSEIGKHKFPPAEYEIVRRVIYATGDFEYLKLLHFSERAISEGAAALAARSTVVVDVPTVSAGILPMLQRTFANQVYCGQETITRPQKEKPKAAWGMENLAKRYPEGVFAIGQDASALMSLVEAIEVEAIRPALLICALSGFVGVEVVKQRLEGLPVPHIRVEGRKGNPIVAVTILNALAELSWIAYGQETRSTG